MLDQDTTKKISEYLTYQEAHSYASSSKFHFFTLQTVIKRQQDYILFVNKAKERLQRYINDALDGINHYLCEDAIKPDLPVDYGAYSLTNPTIRYSKGFRRAECFKDIFLDEKNSLPEKIFALSVLIQESNGKKLKMRVNLRVDSTFPNEYAKKIFGNRFEPMGKALLEVIHDDVDGPMRDLIGCYEDNRKLGFTQQHFREIIECKSFSKTFNPCRIS